MYFQMGQPRLEFALLAIFEARFQRKDQHSQSHALQLGSPPNFDPCELDYARFQEAEGAKGHWSPALKR